MRLQLFHGGEALNLDVEGTGDAREIVLGEERSHASAIALGASSGTLRLDGRPARFLYQRGGAGVRIAVGGECYEFDLSGEIKSKRSGAAHGNPETRAPMPGKVLQVSATPGAEVNPGDPLLILEAMKMENVLAAGVAGTVKEVHVKAGERVDPGQLLVVIEPKQ